MPDAAREFRATVGLRPADVEARFNLGIALAQIGQRHDAIAQLTEALRIKPDLLQARQALADLTARPAKIKGAGFPAPFLVTALQGI